ncbi:hypothetical protein D9M72_345730 [compost metagenome]
MRGDQRHGTGGLVDFAGLDADEAVLDDVDPAHALGAGAAVEFLDGLQRGDPDTVDGDRHAGFEGDDDLIRRRREFRGGGVVVDVLGGGVPDVLEVAGFDGAAPDVLVDRVRVLLGGLDRQSLFLGEGDGLVAGQGEVADRGNALQVRAEGLDAHFEADLVVALAGAAVRHGGGTEFTGGLDQVLDDNRAGDRRDQRVVALVEGVGLQRGHAVLVGEFVAGIGHVGFDGAAAQGTLADGLQRLAALPDVDGHGDDLGTGCFTDPADRYGSIQATGVGQHNTLSHFKCSLVVWFLVVFKLMAGFFSELQEAGGHFPAPLRIPRDQQHGVVPGDGPQDGGHDRVVDGQGQEVRRPRRGPEHHDVRRCLGGNQQFPAQPGKPGVQDLLGDAGLGRTFTALPRNGVHEHAVLAANPDRPEFHEVAGQRGLGDLDAVVRQQRGKLGLRTH